MTDQPTPRRGRPATFSPDRVEDRLQRLEEEMEQVITEIAAGATSAEELDPVRRRQLEQELSGFADRMQQRLQSIEPTSEDQLVASALRLLSPNHLMRLYGHFRMRHRSEHVDDFGADPKFEEQVDPLVEFLYGKYFRVVVEGVQNIPDRGRCLLVANRSGLLPWDSLMIKAAVRREHTTHRRVRWLIEDFVYNQPFLGPVVARLGGVRACQDHAQRLLLQDELVCVFPEGIIGATKLYRDRYRLGRFGRGGYVRLVLRTGTPVVPVAVIGAEEAHPVIGRLSVGGTQLLGVTSIPITPTFPALGPLGLVPVPTKWTVVFGEPIIFDEGPEAANDLVAVRRLNERVRTNLQAMVTEALRRRASVFFG